MMYYCVGINTIILLSVSQLGTLFASGASFWCYININELYIKERLFPPSQAIIIQQRVGQLSLSAIKYIGFYFFPLDTA